VDLQYTHFENKNLEATMNTVNNKTKDIVLNALLIAIVFIATYFIQFQLPFSATGGLVHMGNVALFTIALTLGARKGAIAGAFGMGLFDIVSGWLAWAPGTFIVRGLMGFIIGAISEWGQKRGLNSIVIGVIAILISSIWMLGGYYVVEGLLYGNWIAPVNSIPGNLTQIAIGLVVSVPISSTLKLTAPFKKALSHE
jgi:uncharacterized membrane protein